MTAGTVVPVSSRAGLYTSINGIMKPAIASLNALTPAFKGSDWASPAAAKDEELQEV